MKLVSGLLLGQALAGSAFALNIAVIVDNPGQGADEANFLSTCYGHTVTEIHDLEDNEMGGTGGTANILGLNAYDLVLISRNTNSGDYDANIAAWNNIDTPVILGAGHIIRGNRWDWQDNNGISNNSSPDAVVIDDMDPIFAGTGLSNGDTFQYVNPAGGGAIAASTNSGATNGLELADRTGGGFYIQRWGAGDGTTEFYPGGATYTNERLFFSVPNNFDLLNDTGKQLLANAIYSLVPEPSRALLLGFGGMAMILRRRR